MILLGDCGVTEFLEEGLKTLGVGNLPTSGRWFWWQTQDMNALAPRTMLCLTLLPALVSPSDNVQVIARDNGLEFVSSTNVSDVAVKRAQYVVRRMISAAPEILARMAAAGFKVEIIGKDQVISDLPDYADLKDKKTFDGRSFDDGTRGVGGKNRCSIGEENLLCLRQQKYTEEDILVHEFSHSIMSNMEEKLAGAVEAAYRNARDRGLYPAGIYMMANSAEYWAEGTQAWFDATIRSDVNGGLNTRAKLKTHDPDLAAVLERVFGSAPLPRMPDCVY